ncbi:hypothetical protein BG015_005714, partial [Linnemannia schmuckeri]
YFEEPTRPADERYGDWIYPDATPTVEMNRIKPHASSVSLPTPSVTSSRTHDCILTWEPYYQNPSYPERMVLPLLRHSSRLQELVLGGYSGRTHHLVQTLFESCPDLETLNFGGSDHSVEDEPLAGGMLSKLRILRLRSHAHIGSDKNQAIFSEIMMQSASILEVL